MGWLDRSAGEGASYHGKHVVALLAQRNGAGADHAEILSAIERAEAARDFLFHFRHAGCTFGLVVGERDREVADEAQYGVAVLVETAQQVDRGGLLDAPAGSRIGPLAFPCDVVVAGAAGADVVGAEDDLSLTRRRAKLIAAEQKVAHGLRPRLAGGFFRIQQFAQEMGIAQGMGTVVEAPSVNQLCRVQLAGDTARPYTSWISSAARAYGSIWPCVRCRPRARTLGHIGPIHSRCPETSSHAIARKRM